jgi:hypothetical protein
VYAGREGEIPKISADVPIRRGGDRLFAHYNHVLNVPRLEIDHVALEVRESI